MEVSGQLHASSRFNLKETTPVLLDIPGWAQSRSGRYREQENVTPDASRAAVKMVALRCTDRAVPAIILKSLKKKTPVTVAERSTAWTVFVRADASRSR
jgi:hypothetical protein